MIAPVHQYQKSRLGGNISTELLLEYLEGDSPSDSYGSCAHEQGIKVVFLRSEPPSRW